MLNNQQIIHVTLLRGRKGLVVGNTTFWYAHQACARQLIPGATPTYQ
jgi:hypothetical protein